MAMTDKADAAGDGSGKLWHSLKAMMFRDNGSSLRDQIEDVIDDHVAQEDEESGDLSQVEQQMLRNLLRLGTMRVDDIKVPRSDIVAVPDTISLTDLVGVLAEAAHSRLPVYQGSLDHIVGMVHVKDVLGLISKAGIPPVGISALVRQPLFVPGSMPLLDLLGQMRQQRTHLAIIIDEYSGTDGLATIEDVVEEIVGDIEDEHDDAPDAMMVQDGAGVWTIDARTPLADVAKEIDSRFEETDEDVDTIGGLAFVLAGRVPETGAVIDHDSGWKIEVLDGDARRLLKLRLVPPSR